MTQANLKSACDKLQDLGATFEYPGYININIGKFEFHFGDVNGPIDYDITLDGVFYQEEYSFPALNSHADDTSIEAYVRLVIAYFVQLNLSPFKHFMIKQ